MSTATPPARASRRFPPWWENRSPRSKACPRKAIIPCRRLSWPTTRSSAATARRARSCRRRRCWPRTRTPRRRRFPPTWRGTSAAAAATTRSSPRCSGPRRKHEETAMNAPRERIESFEDVAFQGISRRAFIVTAGGIGVAVAFGGTTGIRKALAQAASFTPNAWIRVAADGTVTLVSPGSEMGQGTMTAMPLLIAEDMDLDWSKVKVEHAPHMPKLYGNPLFGGNMIVGASRTMRGYYEIMRLAGLQAREVMIHNAARHWKVPVSELTTEPHHVVHLASGRKLS